MFHITTSFNIHCTLCGCLLNPATAIAYMAEVRQIVIPVITSKAEVADGL